MSKICVFAGTTEGRRLIEFLSRHPVSVTACVATEYGETLLGLSENLTVSARRLSPEEMADLLQREGFDLVVDATHPYAAAVTEGILTACQRTETPYLRLLRDAGAPPEDAFFAETPSQAVDFLNTAEGNILLTTGSKELAPDTGIRDFSDRVYARVLPMEASLEACQSAGLKPSHILAMQGPFSEEMNLAMLHGISAKYLVTKDGGQAGGFEEKVRAARAAGVRLVVIGRPPQREGLTLAQVLQTLCARFGLSPSPSVAVVGIGPGHPSAMTREVLTAIQEADCIIGARRMVESVSLPGQAVFHGVSPASISDVISAHPEYSRFAVVMSGDVGFFSGTKKLLPLLSPYEVTVLPGLSSLVYLCAKLRTSYEDVLPVSLHGRNHDILPDIRTHGRVFALVGGRNGMADLCTTLYEGGFGEVKVSIGERLSYPDESITVGLAKDLMHGSYAPLSAALIEHAPAAETVVTHGLPDEAFQRGGGVSGVVPMTKSEIRSVCLSKLRLTRDAVCWDVGAGTGSVAIEMALQSEGGRVYAIEQKEDALSLLEENRQRFDLSNLTIVPGKAPGVCEDLPAPTHAFIGGSSGNLHAILTLLLEKNPSVRIVATAIALESVAELTGCLKAFPFSETEVVSLSVAKGRKAGPYHLMTGQNPIHIFTMQAKGEGG